MPPMAQPSDPPKVKLICGLLTAEPALLDEAIRRLGEALGPVDLVSDIMDFAATRYYEAEMGAPLYRRFAAFRDLVCADALAAAKRTTNDIEAKLAAASPIPGVARPVNIDPGYVEPSKLVLASMKNFAHRIYLGRGVYAEVTLLYRDGAWRSLPWTFPDFASGRYFPFLDEARGGLGRRLREAR